MLREREDADATSRAARDARLIAEYRSGRTTAFEELVAAYRVPLARVFAQLRARPCDVDDLTQDVFIRVYANLHTFDGKASFYTWFYRVTLNVYFDSRKRAKRADERIARLGAVLADPSAALERGDPATSLERSSLGEEVRTAVRGLPADFREILVLREFEDLSYADIAARSGLSIGNVRSRLSRARRRLRSALTV